MKYDGDNLTWPSHTNSALFSSSVPSLSVYLSSFLQNVCCRLHFDPNLCWQYLPLDSPQHELLVFLLLLWPTLHNNNVHILQKYLRQMTISSNLCCLAISSKFHRSKTLRWYFYMSMPILPVSKYTWPDKGGLCQSWKAAGRFFPTSISLPGSSDLSL